MLHNIRIICPLLATYVINSYNEQARLFILGGKEIKSSEGTTQGDPISMAVHALGMLPMLSVITTLDTRHVAFADDLTGAGTIDSLYSWWKKICEHGPSISYNPKAEKSWLIVKPEKLKLAENIFADTNINITVEGKRHLGAAIGKTEFKAKYIREIVQDWCMQIKVLSKVAKIYPQSAYCAFTSGFRQKFNYILRTMPNIKEYLAPVEHEIRHTFIPSLFENKICNNDERLLLSLPCKMGGLGIINPMEMCDIEFSCSSKITFSLQSKIMNQAKDYDSREEIQTNLDIKNVMKAKNEYFAKSLLCLREKMNDEQLKANDIACNNGASVWLTTLPIKTENFSLSKREFVDAIYIRYGWNLNRLPMRCACSALYSIEHALCCKTGGFITLRHNEIRDISADLLSEVCNDVKKEPPLTTVENKEDLRADVSVTGFWEKRQRAFFDVMVFYPFAPSYRNQNLSATFVSMEKKKKRKYNERILQNEQSTFTPLIFSSNGGMSRETAIFTSRLGEMLSEKRNIKKSDVMAWLKRKFAFSIIRSLIICIRGTRSRRHVVPICESDIDICNASSIIREN